jgi:hypothetical protein
VANKRLRGIIAGPKRWEDAGRLTGSGELTTKVRYHTSYWKSRKIG